MIWKEFIKKKKELVDLKKKFVKTKDIGREGIRKWITEAITLMKQCDNDEKILVIERNSLLSTEGIVKRKLKPGYVHYRIGYYIVGKNGNKKDKWTWGQYNPHIPIEDFNKLFELAKKEKTILE